MVNLNDKIFYKSATLYFLDEHTKERESWLGKKKEFDGRNLNLKAKVGGEEMLVSAEISYPIINQVLRLIEKDTFEEKLLKPIKEELLNDISSAEKEIERIYEISKYGRIKHDKLYPLIDAKKLYPVEKNVEQIAKETGIEESVVKEILKDAGHRDEIEWAHDRKSFYCSYRVYDNFYTPRPVESLAELKNRKIYGALYELERLAKNENLRDLMRDIEIEEKGSGRGSGGLTTKKGQAYVSGSGFKDALEKYLLCYKYAVEGKS